MGGQGGGGLGWRVYAGFENRGEHPYVCLRMRVRVGAHARTCLAHVLSYVGPTHMAFWPLQHSLNRMSTMDCTTLFIKQ